MKIRDGQKLNQQDVAVIKMASLFLSLITSPPPQVVVKKSPDDEKTLNTPKTSITAEAKQQPTSYQLSHGQQVFLIMVDLWSSWGGEESLQPLVNDIDQTNLNNIIEEAYSSIVSPLQKTLAIIQDPEIIRTLHDLQDSNRADNIPTFFWTIKLHIDKESKEAKNADMAKATKAIETFIENGETCNFIQEGLLSNYILLVNLRNVVGAYIQMKQAKERSLEQDIQPTTKFLPVESKPEAKSRTSESKEDTNPRVEAGSSIRKPTKPVSEEEEEEENDDEEEAQAIALSLLQNPSVPGNNSPKGDSIIGSSNLFLKTSTIQAPLPPSQSGSITPDSTPTLTVPSSDPPLDQQMGGPTGSR